MFFQKCISGRIAEGFFRFFFFSLTLLSLQAAFGESVPVVVEMFVELWWWAWWLMTMLCRLNCPAIDRCRDKRPDVPEVRLVDDGLGGGKDDDDVGETWEAESRRDCLRFFRTEGRRRGGVADSGVDVDVDVLGIETMWTVALSWGVAVVPVGFALTNRAERCAMIVWVWGE